jgi:chromosome partitioning protein
VNLAACFSESGQRTLLVDLDPQGNATTGLGVGRAERISIYDVLINNRSIQDAVIEIDLERLWLVPSELDLAGAELELMPRISRESVLRSRLAEEQSRYDFIFIDAPPSLGLLTLNALVAADYAIVPIQCEYFALEGVSQLLKTVDLIQHQLNPTLEIGHVILTMYDNRVRLNQQVVDEVRNVFQGKVARTVIPRNVRIAESPSHGLPVTRYDPRSRGAIAYREITEEIINDGKARARSRIGSAASGATGR